jgi:hypothetical protein
MTPDNLRDVLAEARCPDCGHAAEAHGGYPWRDGRCRFPSFMCPCTTNHADALAPTVARLIADARAEGIRWGHEEAGSAYVCGRRDGRAEQALVDRERIEALADEWESRAANARSCAEARLGLSDAEGLHAHADLMQRRADDLRAALDSEGGEDRG